MHKQAVGTQRLVIGAVCGAAFFLSGCLATSNELMGLRDDIYELQVKLNDLQKNQADLSTKMDELNGNLGPLSAQLEETQNRMSLLGTRLDDVESSISQKVNRLSEQLSGKAAAATPQPSEVYRLAYSDFSSGKYDLAIVGFSTYLEKFPQGELAAQAQYYLGECYFAQDNWQKALAEFQKVSSSYPNSESVLPALLKQALCLELTGRVKEGRELLRKIVREHPNTSEAFTAQEKLKAASADGK